jgi:SAM-dependent methyltransferase
VSGGSIDDRAVGRAYARWFLHAPGRLVVRYLFSRRGLWVLNTPYRRLLSAAEITAADRVLDVGCGLASLLIALAERIPFQSPAIGIDVSEELIQQAAREVRRVGLEDRRRPPPICRVPTAPSTWCSARMSSSTSTTGPWDRPSRKSRAC